MNDFLNALERCIRSQLALADRIDEQNPGDRYASLMVRDDVEVLQQSLETLRGTHGVDSPDGAHPT
jgi:hypothetical protein